MRLVLNLKGKGQRNMERAIAALQGPDTADFREAMAAHMLSLAAAAVARAGGFCIPIGCSMELRPWSREEWRAYTEITGEPIPERFRAREGAL